MDQSKNVAGADVKTLDGKTVESRTADGKTVDASKQMVPERGILGAMSAAGKFTTFVAGIKAAGLTDRLSGSGSYTVFAPTDDAFKKLPAGALDALLKDTGKLAAVLNYHVIAGHIEAKHVKEGALATLQGSTLKVETPGQQLRVNGANVTQADMIASNGVVHAIDTVILPASWQLLAAAA